MRFEESSQAKHSIRSKLPISAFGTRRTERATSVLKGTASGIDPSDDPIINTRTEAYAESFGRCTK